jgi:hypothetical protein
MPNYGPQDRESVNVEDRRGEGLLTGALSDYFDYSSVPAQASALWSLVYNKLRPGLTPDALQEGQRQLGAMLPGRSLEGTQPTSLTPEPYRQAASPFATAANGAGISGAAPTLSQLLRGIK